MVGEPAHFDFSGSSVRRGTPSERVGGVGRPGSKRRRRYKPRWPLRANKAPMIPVHLHSQMTAIGTLEASCLSRDGRKIGN